MTKQNVYDLATDLLKSRVNLAFQQLRQQYKNTNPYRKEPVSTKEQLLKYAEFTPDKELVMRQALGDEVVDNYHARMQTLMRRQRQ